MLAVRCQPGSGAPSGNFSGVAPGVLIGSGGLKFDLLYDAAALAAPASFRAGIEQAAAMIAAAIPDPITVNIKIDYSGTGGGAVAGPDNGLFETYSSIGTDLVNNASPGDATFNALPSGSSVQGQSLVAAWNAQLKLWGFIGANDTTTDDGQAIFSTDIAPSLLVGVALHELTHALGRVPYGPQPDIFDLFRFTSSGKMLFSGSSTAPAAWGRGVALDRYRSGVRAQPKTRRQDGRHMATCPGASDPGGSEVPANFRGRVDFYHAHRLGSVPHEA